VIVIQAMNIRSVQHDTYDFRAVRMGLSGSLFAVILKSDPSHFEWQESIVTDLVVSVH